MPVTTRKRRSTDMVESTYRYVWTDPRFETTLTKPKRTATLLNGLLNVEGMMPDFKPVLSPEELAKRRTSRSTRVDLTPYIDYLRTIRPGYAGDIELNPGENKPTIKRRITMAANRVGKTVKYLRSGDSELIFELQAD